MHIGIATVTLRIPENDNLKGKRRIVHSIASRARSRFNVAIAEVGENESWQTPSSASSASATTVATPIAPCGRRYTG